VGNERWKEFSLKIETSSIFPLRTRRAICDVISFLLFFQSQSVDLVQSNPTFFFPDLISNTFILVESLYFCWLLSSSKGLVTSSFLHFDVKIWISNSFPRLSDLTIGELTFLKVVTIWELSSSISSFLFRYFPLILEFNHKNISMVLLSTKWRLANWSFRGIHNHSNRERYDTIDLNRFCVILDDSDQPKGFWFHLDCPFWTEFLEVTDFFGTWANATSGWRI
jgi:hypothetical protein